MIRLLISGNHHHNGPYISLSLCTNHIHILLLLEMRKSRVDRPTDYCTTTRFDKCAQMRLLPFVFVFTCVQCVCSIEYIEMGQTFVFAPAYNYDMSIWGFLPFGVSYYERDGACGKKAKANPLRWWSACRHLHLHDRRSLSIMTSIMMSIVMSQRLLLFT